MRSDELPEAVSRAPELWRADVFDVALQWRKGAATARQLVAAVLMWGYGPTGYGPWRASRTLAGDPEGVRLQRHLELLRGEHVSVAQMQTTYERFMERKRLPYLGPAFFTKVIYFAGYRRGAGGIQPLILDSVVAGRLPSVAGVDARRWLWPVDQWMSFIEWAAAQGRAEPDEVELAYFNGEV